jgi:endonuclease/exonuclease/phosphatase family metal-dependent hydrolase
VLLSRRSAAVAAALAVVAVAGPAATASAKPKAKAKPDVTVMSRNLYLGADIIKLVSAANVDDMKQQVKTLHEDVDKTNFPVRATAIAAEIAAKKPDLIAVQEVARYYRSADATPGQAATTPLYDFMALLQKALKGKKQTYKVASEQTEMDITVPSAEGYGLRLKLGNAVLVRAGSKVAVTKKLAGDFDAATQLKVTLADGQAVKLTRGYAGVDAKVAGKAFRFLAPHAEAYGAALAKGQFEELLAGPAKSKKVATIIAGDFNSDPADAEPNAYKAVTAAGFVDTGKRVPTCCQAELLDNPTSQLKTWIDHIVVRPKATVLKTSVFGDKASDRVSGLWPSDHAGVVATIRLK